MLKRLSIILISFIVLLSFFGAGFHHHDDDHGEHDNCPLCLLCSSGFIKEDNFEISPRKHNVSLLDIAKATIFLPVYSTHIASRAPPKDYA